MIGGEQISALFGRDRLEVVLPVIREDLRSAALVKPVYFPFTAEKNPAKDHAPNARGMLGGVSQGQRGAPTSPKNHPGTEAQMLADELDVVHEIPGGIFLELGARGGAATTALVEKHNPIVRGIEEAAVNRIATAARPSVQENHGLPVGIPALFHVKFMERGGFEHLGLEGFDFRIKFGHISL